MRVTVHIYAEKMVDVSKVSHGEFLAKRVDGGIEEFVRVCDQDDIINVQQEVGDVWVIFVDEQGCVIFGGIEAKSLQEGCETYKPCSRSLLEPI